MRVGLNETKPEAIAAANDVKKRFTTQAALHKKLKQQQQTHISKAELDTLEKERLLKEQADLAEMTVDELVSARETVKKIKQKIDMPFRTEPCGWALLYTFLEDEKINDKEHIARYLDNCDVATKEQDFNKIHHELKTYLNHPNNQGTKAHADLSVCYKQLQQDKNIVPKTELNQLTLLTARALFMAKHPRHLNNHPHFGINKHRGQKSAKQISYYGWGKVLSGLFFAMLGATFMVGVPLVKRGWKERKLGHYMGGVFKCDTKELSSVAAPVTHNHTNRIRK